MVVSRRANGVINASRRVRALCWIRNGKVRLKEVKIHPEVQT